MARPRNLFIEASSITESRVSGIGHMTAELIRALERHPENGKTFRIVLIVCGDKARYLRQWGYRDVKVITLPVTQRIFNLIWKFDLLPPMDIFFGKGTYIFPNYKNWRLAFSKSLTFVCDVSYIVVPQFVQPQNRVFLTKNIKKWITRTDKVLTISTNAQEEIITYLGVQRTKTAIVSCGVDPEVFSPRPAKEVAEFSESFNLPEDFILYLGNIEPRKNVERLIEAYKFLPDSVRAKHPLLLVGGGGWLNEPILQAIEEARSQGYNVLRPSEYIPDTVLPVLHSAAAILVHPAFYEGFGISPLQAMACGTPVVVADNSSLPEVVGDAGLLVDANITADISAKMDILLSDTDLATELTKKGLVQARKYTWEKSAKLLYKQTEDVWK